MWGLRRLAFREDGSVQLQQKLEGFEFDDPAAWRVDDNGTLIVTFGGNTPEGRRDFRWHFRSELDRLVWLDANPCEECGVVQNWYFELDE